MQRLFSILEGLLVSVALAATGVAAEEPGAHPPPRPFEEEITFIETLRGLELPEIVEHRTIPRDELKEHLRAAWARDLPMDDSDYFAVLRALHLIEEATDDPLEVLLDLYVSQVLAFYDPIEDLLYSIEEAPDSELGIMNATFQRAVMIHELVHAMQDQIFDAGTRLSERVDDWDRSLAYHALIEGEATLVMLAVVIEDLGGSLDEILSDDDVLEGFAEAAAIDLSQEGTPAYFVESLKFPYVDGLTYAIAAYREGGWDTLARAHQAPPSSTEEIYDGELPKKWVEPIEHEKALIETTLGEFHWRFLLGEDVADGWEADRVAVVRSAHGLHVLAATLWDSEANASRFQSAYREFLERRGHTPAVHRTGTSVIVAYGPDDALVADFVERRLNRDLEMEIPSSQ